MAGIGPAPNPASGRSAYRKKKGAGAVLSRDVEVEMPPLPSIDRDWHPLVEAWWEDVWDSPMAQEYDASDIHGLYALALMVDDFWKAESISARKEASQEIRLQGLRFGLSPLDRRRLQWEIEKAEDAQNRAKKRKAREETSSRRPEGPTDPRAALRAL